MSLFSHHFCMHLDISLSYVKKQNTFTTCHLCVSTIHHGESSRRRSKPKNLCIEKKNSSICQTHVLAWKWCLLPILLEIIGMFSMHDYRLSSSLFWCLVVLLNRQISTTLMIVSAQFQLTFSVSTTLTNKAK